MATPEPLEEMGLDDDDIFEDFVKRVLDKTTVDIVEKLEPDGILDIFLERNILGATTYVTIRDIREKENTSEKNRGIRDVIRRCPEHYVTFKAGLASTGQQGLLDDLEAIETELHDSSEDLHFCDSTESCRLLQQLKYQQLIVSTSTSKIVHELQQYLLCKYVEENTYWENPLTSEEAWLSEMYVQPSVKRIREINEHGEIKGVKEAASHPCKLKYKDIFQSKYGENCTNIYITGDAGTGKSTFCNQLVLNWCSAVQNKTDGNVSTEDHVLLSSFRFLFHINLRDTETTYHVEDMVQEQLLANAPGSFNISDILKTERCLVVLDGLDEWVCPGDVKKCPNINKDIPGRNTANKNCHFLTTSRNWKYDVISLKNKDRDKHVELSGIDEKSSEELAKKMLIYLDRDFQKHKTVAEFLKDVRKKKLNVFLTVPVLIIQLITLWFFGKDFGNSQMKLYCSMLDLLFERSEKNLPGETSKCSSTNMETANKLPECFSPYENCQKHAKLLHCLAKMAYKALYNKQKGEALVFKSSRLEIFGISPSDIKLCLQCGILSQCKDYGNYTGRYKKFSFLHTKLQECLAALYLVTNGKVGDIVEIEQFCNSLETRLEMSQVWLFVAGMDPHMTGRLMEHLAHIVSSDERVKTYRQTVGYNDYRKSISNIQRCICNCVLEGFYNGHPFIQSVRLEDFRVDCLVIREVECLLFCSDMSKVKSVFIRTRNIHADKLADITSKFQQCRSIQHLDLFDPDSLIPVSTAAALVDNNCDALTSVSYSTEITATDKLVTAICKCIRESLIALWLSLLKLTHAHKEQVLHNLSKSPVIRQLVLNRLDCTDHGNECIVRIDLSAMNQLQKLTLLNIHVDNLQSIPHFIEIVELRFCTIKVTSLREFARRISKLRRKVTVWIECVTFTETCEECGDLNGSLLSCPGFELTECEYKDSDNTWNIKFNTGNH